MSPATGELVAARPQRAVSLRWVVLVCVLAAALQLSGVWARSTYGAQVSVDEPQYLLTTMSLADDFDLDIADEIAGERYRVFHENRLNQQTIPVDDAGRRFSPHDPLLPLMLVPGWMLGGWVGARLSLVLIASLTAGLTFWLAASRFAVRPATAAVVTVCLFGSQPLAPYASQIYPEMAAAFFVVVATLALTERGVGASLSAPVSVGRLVAAAVCVVALPWLAVKYVPAAGAIALWAGVRLWVSGQRSLLLPGGLVLGVAGVVYAVVHQRIYGGWTVYAAGDHFVETGEFAVVGTRVNLAGRSRRLWMLLVDRRFGIAAWQPLWLVLPVGLVALARRQVQFRWAALVAVAGYLTAVFVALTMHGWWSPGRQVVVIAPLLVVAVAWLVDQAPGSARLVAAVVGAFGVSNWLWLSVEANTGRRAIVVDFMDTAAPVYSLLRPLFPDPRADLVEWLGPMWAVLFVVLAAIGWRLGRSPTPVAAPAVQRRLLRSVTALRRAG